MLPITTRLSGGAAAGTSGERLHLQDRPGLASGDGTSCAERYHGAVLRFARGCCSRNCSIEYGRFDVEHVETLHEAIERLNEDTYDVVLLDLSLPDGQGRETFDMVHAAAPATPVVVLTGLDDEPTALAMVHAGAQDYLVKSGILDGPLVARSVASGPDVDFLQKPYTMSAAAARIREMLDRRAAADAPC